MKHQLRPVQPPPHHVPWVLSGSPGGPGQRIKPARHLHRPEALGSSEPVCCLDTTLCLAGAGSRPRRPLYQLRRRTSRGCAEPAAGVAAASGEARLSRKAIISERKKKYIFFFCRCRVSKKLGSGHRMGRAGLLCTDQILFQPAGRRRLLAAARDGSEDAGGITWPWNLPGESEVGEGEQKGVFLAWFPCFRLTDTGQEE